jgi:cytochrome c biogenesis protein CcdA
VIVVRTATGRSLHLSTDMQITHCGYRVASQVWLWELARMTAVCSPCMGTVVPVVLTVMVGELSKRSSTPTQEPPGPKHEGMRPVRGRRRST